MGDLAVCRVALSPLVPMSARVGEIWRDVDLKFSSIFFACQAFFTKNITPAKNILTLPFFLFITGAMKTKLKQYIEIRGITIKQAAMEIGVSRPLVHYAINGNPLSRRTALKIEQWSDGFVPAVELVGLGSKRAS